MPSLISGYEYDIFISYRQKDNKGERWVTEFVNALKTELEATFKEDISIYFDENPHDGLLETHDVDDSLKDKLKCLIFVPIISQTYCDPKSFAWNHEFLEFKKLATEDQIGLKVKLASGNVSRRILPVRIHDLDVRDKALLENEVGPLRSIDFIFKSAGVNRPLRSHEDHPNDNLNKTYYRDQVNKVANAIKEIIASRLPKSDETIHAGRSKSYAGVSITKRSKKVGALFGITFVLALASYFIHTPENADINSTGQSVAVLPFDNFSASDEAQYFADGVMVAVLNNLSKIKDLKVISSTSVEIYRKTPKTIKEIASELNVNHVIQGNVQRDGNKVRVTVQLINAVDDDQVWSENYDRNLEDIFVIQSDIAQNVARQLQVTLQVSEKRLIGSAQSYNLNAYDEYLRGKDKLSKYNVFGREEDYRDGVRYLKMAITHDTTLSPAYAELALANFARNHDRDLFKENFGDSAIHLANKALAINPDLSQAYLLRGQYYVNYNSSFDQAEKEFRKAIELDPNNAQNYISFAFAFIFVNPAMALENFFIGLRLDPNTYEKSIIYAWISWIYITAGHFDMAESYALKSLEIEPNNREGYRALVHNYKVQSKDREAITVCEQWKKMSPYALRYLQEIYVAQGKYEEAEKCFIEFEKLYPDEFNYKQRYGVVLWKLGKIDKAHVKFDEAIKEYELMIRLRRPQMISSYYDLAGVLSFMGKPEEAHKWMRKWDDFGLPVGLETYATTDALFENVQDDKVFKSCIEKAKKRRIGLAAELKEIAGRYEFKEGNSTQ